MFLRVLINLVERHKYSLCHLIFQTFFFSQRRLFLYGLTALVGQDLLIVDISRLHSDIPHLLGVPWTNDRPEFTSARQHTTDRHP